MSFSLENMQKIHIFQLKSRLFSKNIDITWIVLTIYLYKIGIMQKPLIIHYLYAIKLSFGTKFMKKLAQITKMGVRFS